MIPFAMNKLGLSGVRLPSGFRKLEYLRYPGGTTDAAHCLYLGFRFGELDSIKFTLRSFDTANDDVLFGSSGNTGYLAFDGRDALTLKFSTILLFPATVPPLFSPAIKGNGVFNAVSVSFNISEDTPSLDDIAIGGYISVRYARQKDFKAITFFRAGVILADYIPYLCLAGHDYVDGNTGETVTAISDKPGMFDVVSGKFFVNQGTGEFLYE